MIVFLSNRTATMTDDAAAFESEVQGHVLLILAEVQRLLEINEAASDASGMLTLRIEEMCNRWTEVERVRNLIHARVAAGSEWRNLYEDADMALRDLWRAVASADACLRSHAIEERQRYAMPRLQADAGRRARDGGCRAAFRAHRPGVA